jgi:ligand-binding sensor domain-containing protein
MLLLLAVLSLSHSVCAATTTPASARWMVDRWTVEDGLPMNHINALAHGVDGRLWIATYDGLWSFDGSRFTRAPIDGLDGTAGVRVHDLVRAPSTDDLWITLEDGPVQRRGPTGIETWHPGLPGPYELHPDARGSLWMAGPVHCVLLVDAADRTAAPVFPDATPGPSDCPPGRPATEPLPTTDPLQTTPAGQVLDGSTPVLDLGHPIRDALWLDGQLWLATTGAGLVRLRPRVVEVVEAPAGRSPIVSRLQWDSPTNSVWARSHDDTWWSVTDPTAPVEPAGLHTPRPGRLASDRKSLPFPPPPWDSARRWWATQRELRRETESGDVEPISGPHDFWQGIQSRPCRCPTAPCSWPPPKACCASGPPA